MAENENDLNSDGVNEDILNMFKSNLSTMTTPKVDTSAVDKQIKNLSTPASGSVYDKQAALYRMQGSGRVLETQKNIALAITPALELYKTRKAASDAEFQERTKNMPDYDDTNIFGEINNTTIPLSDNIKNISNLLKEDYRLISNLNINDPRYEEARKRIEQNEKIIVNYDAVNKKLFDIRNGRDRDTGEVIQQIPLEEFDEGMSPQETQMWKDIYSGNGSNIKNIDGNLFWVDPTDPENKDKQIDLRYISNSPTQINGVSVNAYVTHRGIEAKYINEGGLLDDYSYTATIEASLNNLRRLKPNEIKSLIFNGINVEPDDIYGGPDTKEFILKVIKDTYGGNLNETEILAKIDEMKSISVIDATKYKDENGNNVSLKKLFLRYETNKTRNAIQEAADKREEENKNKNTNTTPKVETDDEDLEGGGEDIVVGSVNVTKLNQNTFYRVFQQTEDNAKKILENLLPKDKDGKSIYTIEDDGTPRDRLKIFKNNVLVDIFDFDYSNEDLAKDQAYNFLRKIKNVGFFTEITESSEINNNIKESFLSLPINKKKLIKAAKDGTLTPDIIKKAIEMIQNNQSNPIKINEQGVIEGKINPTAFNKAFKEIQEIEKIDLGY
jgi:hypothetical protein